MTHLQIMLWLCVAAYGAHVLEEFIFDWRTWSQQVLHLPTRWDDFYITNCLVIVVGIVAVEIAPEYPAVSLGFPALMLINATLMHAFPFVRSMGRRFSPGLITAALLFWPLGTYTMLAAELNARVVITAFLVGAALLALPISFLLLRRSSYFDQTRAY
ncbi:HXXEE domain-containing protein [Terriglobus sp. TAA 43]|uniref:HXXEE domain-containing protein n=1 Tax=Terriglobus sp. TAA 43 TaxID=278961 RepID=UPI000645FB60|nr:HXXEE domain-containing protein [Terriglobus sp. TAA 43]